MDNYPKWVTPDRQAWLDATTPEARRAAKVLVADEAEHRLVVPGDFEPVAASEPDEADGDTLTPESVIDDVPGEAVPVKRRPGRPRKVLAE